ncbi:sensor histidine kinase [Fodinicola acaciae]|uniref:sensor histidine kinase n=1 Tax=Fodinicola acaciae TaxID=2681555 RepID=UPI001FEB1162|nr:sensor histidine kinase [Fodinicola acaciae]
MIGPAAGFAAEAGKFRHPALFYRTDQDYLDGLLPFVTDGVAGGEPVAVAVPGPRLQLLADAMDSAGREAVTFIDMTEAGRNPGRIIATVLLRFADAHRGRPVRIVGEPVWPGRTAVEHPACAQHEALINAAFAGRDATIVCPYDAARLEKHALRDAYATHPLIWDGQRRYASDRYAPEAVVDRYNQPLPSQGATYQVDSADDIPDARQRATAYARQLGLPVARLPELGLIATELATNSVLHANGRCRLRVWREEDHLVCEVADAGQLTDPLAGRRTPPRWQPHGRGLLLVHQLADLVRTHTSPGGTTQQALLRIETTTSPPEDVGH